MQQQRLIKNADGKHLVTISGDPLLANFKSGSTTSHELAGWQPSVVSPEDEARDYPAIRGRAQDLSRNNGYASGAVQSTKDNVVGAVYKLSLRPAWRQLGISHEEANEWATQVEEKFHLWADDPECWVDAQRKMTFTQIIRQSVGSDFVNGEFMLSRQWRPDVRTPFATCFSVVEPERVCNPQDKAVNPKRAIEQGVELDRYGAAVAYHVRKRSKITGWNYQPDKWQRITKYNAYGWRQFLHIFEATRGDQQRGASKFASTIQKLKMLDRYEDVELEAAILSATYAMVVESDFGAESVFNAMGAGNQGFGDVFQELIKNKVAYKAGNDLQWNGTKIPHLFPGEELKQIVSSHPNKVFAEFEDAMLRHVARGFGTSFEQLTGDYSKTTYSSARASMLEAWKAVTSKRTSVSEKGAIVIFRLWLDEAISRGEVVLPKANQDYWNNRNAWSRCTFIGAGRGQIDDMKAAKANEIKLRTGETTLQQVAAENGQDYQEIIEQSARELKMRVDALERAGVTVTDEMKMRMLGLNGGGESLVFGVEE